MKTKRLLSGLICSIMAISATISSFSAAVNAANDDAFVDLNQSQIVAEMGAGWNLGNQLEASSNKIPSETAWGNPVIKRELIQAVKQAGFKSIRIPVSYLNYIGEGPNYTIDASWLNRVKEVVDYAIDEGLYVIMNMHGDGYYTVDGGWLLCAEPADKQVEIKAKYEACWRQIANIYKDYDEHLIFESMNEEFDGKYNGQNFSAYENINAYNQIFVDTVRKTGSNNAKRWLLIPGWNTDIDQTVSPQGGYSFKIPTDNNLDSSVSGKRIMVSVHYYNPWDFCGDGTSGNYSQWGKDADPKKTPSYGQTEASMETQIKKVYDKFVKEGYPVVIGEFGAINKSSSDPENNKFRAHYCNTLCELSKKYGCVPVYWDNGASSNSFGLINRSSYKIVMPTIVNAMVSVYSTPSDNLTRLISIVNDLSESDYSEETWTALMTELDSAKKVSDNTSSTDEQLEEAYNSLLNSMNALKQGERPSNVRPFAKKVTEVTYNITSTNSGEFMYQYCDADEAGEYPTYTINVEEGTHDYNITPPMETTGFWNLGFANLPEGSSDTMIVNSITINGYKFENTDLKIGNSLSSDGYNNALINIWQGLTGTFDSVDKAACLVVDSKKIEFSVYEVDPNLPLPTKPDPTKPDPTKPDPTKPDPTKPDPTGSDPTKPNPTVNTSTKPTSKATRSKDAVKKDKKAAQKAMKQAKLTSLKVKSKAKKKINVTWKKVKKAKGYQVQVSTNKKFKKSKIIFKKDLKKTKLNIKNKKIKSKKTYFVRVRAYATYKNTNNKTVKVFSKWNKKLRKVTVK